MQPRFLKQGPKVAVATPRDELGRSPRQPPAPEFVRPPRRAAALAMFWSSEAGACPNSTERTRKRSNLSWADLMREPKGLSARGLAWRSPELACASSTISPNRGPGHGRAPQPWLGDPPLGRAPLPQAVGSAKKAGPHRALERQPTPHATPCEAARGLAAQWRCPPAPSGKPHL